MGKDKKIKKIKIDYYNLLRVTVAILIACIIAVGIIFIFSKEPIVAIEKLFLGPLQSKRNFFMVLATMIPLVFTGLAIGIMFKSGLFNMAADSSFYIGAVLAAAIALSFDFPSGVHQGVIIIVAALVGGVLATLPALIKKVTSASELVTSLMLNYVFFYVGWYIINKNFLDPASGYTSFKFPKSAKLPVMVEGTQLHYGFILMVVVVIFMHYLSEKSKLGYQIKITGANQNFAKSAGIKVGSTILISQFIGGALAGMGGAIEKIGMYSRFIWNSPVMYVWDGILVNLLASSKPLLVPIAAFFLSYIRVGADVMSRSTDVDNEIVAVIQAVIILFVSAERFMYNYKKKREEKEALLYQQISDNDKEAAK